MGAVAEDRSIDIKQAYPLESLDETAAVLLLCDPLIDRILGNMDMDACSKPACKIDATHERYFGHRKAGVGPHHSGEAAIFPPVAMTNIALILGKTFLR